MPIWYFKSIEVWVDPGSGYGAGAWVIQPVTTLGVSCWHDHDYLALDSSLSSPSPSWHKTSTLGAQRWTQLTAALGPGLTWPLNMASDQEWQLPGLESSPAVPRIHCSVLLLHFSWGHPLESPPSCVSVDSSLVPQGGSQGESAVCPLIFLHWGLPLLFDSFPPSLLFFPKFLFFQCLGEVDLLLLTVLPDLQTCFSFCFWWSFLEKEPRFYA